MIEVITTSRSGRFSLQRSRHTVDPARRTTADEEGRVDLGVGVHELQHHVVGPAYSVVESLAPKCRTLCVLE